MVRIGFVMALTTLWGYALDIPTYYALDIKTMEVSLKGAKAHLKCLQNHCPQKEEYALYSRIQEETMLLYKNEGTTPSKHIGFYTKHSKAAKAYYDNNETLQERYHTLSTEIESITAEINTLKKVKK